MAKKKGLWVRITPEEIKIVTIKSSIHEKIIKKIPPGKN